MSALSPLATGTPECVWPARAILGEGPVWRDGALIWVDIKAPAIHRFTPATGARESWPMAEQIGCIAPDANGGWLAAVRSGFVHLDLGAPGKPPRLAPIASPEATLPGNRFNDGKLAPDGAFWAGTMDDAEAQDSGAWWRLASDGTARKLDEGYRVTNGPAFDPSRRRVYLTDSAKRTVYAATLTDDGGFADKHVWRTFDAEQGFPDGMTTDADGGLWIAFWDGSCIRRFDPEGELVQTIETPTPRPTSLAFSDDGSRIYITSASIGLPAGTPGAGDLFAVTVS
jgi:sugar lactone lactonase YvrE